MFHTGKITVYLERTYFKIRTTGQMTNSNILETCRNKDMKPACLSSRLADSNCVLTQADDIWWIQGWLAKAICQDPELPILSSSICDKYYDKLNNVVVYIPYFWNGPRNPYGFGMINRVYNYANE